MKRGLDWYKREPRAVIDGNRAARMTTRTWAVFDLLLDLIYEGGGQTPDDPSYVAGHFQDIGPAVARKEIAHLIELGKIDREGAFLTNKRAKNQAKTRQNLSETRAKVGQKGGISSGVSRSQPNENNNIAEANASSKNEAEKRERREERDAKASPKKTPAAILSEVLGSGLAAEVVAHRQRIRKPLTAKAATLLSNKFARCRDPCAGAELMIERGWQGFEPEWMENTSRQNGSKADERWKSALDVGARFDERRASQRDVAGGEGEGDVVPLLPTRSHG